MGCVPQRTTHIAQNTHTPILKIACLIVAARCTESMNTQCDVRGGSIAHLLRNYNVVPSTTICINLGGDCDRRCEIWFPIFTFAAFVGREYGTSLTPFANLCVESADV